MARYGASVHGKMTGKQIGRRKAKCNVCIRPIQILRARLPDQNEFKNSFVALVLLNKNKLLSVDGNGGGGGAF